MGKRAILYPPPVFHIESMWNPCGMKIFHGIHMELHWNPCGIHVESMFIPWNDSMWIPCSFQVDSIFTPSGMGL